MAFTMKDLHDLIRILEKHPEWRTELRRLLLTDQLLELPVIVRELAEAQRRTEERVEALAEAQRRTEEQVRALTQQVQALAEAQRRTEERVSRVEEELAKLAEAQRRTEEQVRALTQQVQALAEAQQRTEERVSRVEEELAKLAEAQRRTEEQVRALTQQVQALAEAQQRTEERVSRVEEELAKLAEAQRRTEEQVRALTEAQRRTEEQVRALTEAQRRTEEQVQALTEAQRRIEQQVADLVAAQQRTERTLQRLLEWQQGEAGRREGERYERRIVVRAPNLFFGGEGGAPGEPDVRRQLSRWLHPFYREGRAPDPPADPLLADLIWWKGEEVFVVEVSQKVDPQDIHRARQRADTLREAGVNATPAVIGEEWATPESQALAQQESVEWLVGGGLSQGFLRFRRLSAETLENPPREG